LNDVNIYLIEYDRFSLTSSKHQVITFKHHHLFLGQMQKKKRRKKKERIKDLFRCQRHFHFWAKIAQVIKNLLLMSGPWSHLGILCLIQSAKS